MSTGQCLEPRPSLRWVDVVRTTLYLAKRCLSAYFQSFVIMKLTVLLCLPRALSVEFSCGEGELIALVSGS